MLEFWLDPESPYHKTIFATGKEFVFFCNGAWRSALAADTAQQMGLEGVFEMEGGFTAWKNAGLPVAERAKKGGIPMRFKDQVALITAAASGIGKATAEIIGAEGGIVVGVDTDQGRLDKLRRVDPRHRRPRARPRRQRARRRAGAGRSSTPIVREHGRIDILVNAVGGSTVVSKPAAPVDELPLRRLAEAAHVQPRRHVPLLVTRWCP